MAVRELHGTLDRVELAEVRSTLSTAWRLAAWVRAHPVKALAVVAALLFYSLALVEVGHWLAEGTPPVGEHLAEMVKHLLALAGIGEPAKWMW